MGAGPAGPTVGSTLRAAGVACPVPETGTRESIECRHRAGVIEERAVRGPEERGLAHNLLARAERHTACEFRSGGERYRFSYRELTGGHHWVHPQRLLVTDLVRACAGVRGRRIRFGVRDVRLHGPDGDRPPASYLCPRTGRREAVGCGFVAGRDGARGVTGACVAPERALVARHDYGIGRPAVPAEAVGVPKMTVTDHFPLEEDLVLDAHDLAVDGLARTVRERMPGESACHALHREYVAGPGGADPVPTGHSPPGWCTAAPGCGPVSARSTSSASTCSRAPATATGAAAHDLTPHLAAHRVVFRLVRRPVRSETPAAKVDDAAVGAAREAFALLEPVLGRYAVRAA